MSALIIDDDHLSGLNIANIPALIRSRAQVSEATTYAPSTWPRQSGRTPCGSLTAISSFSRSIRRLYAPLISLQR